MCFSASASFTAAVTIGAIGVAGLRSCKSANERPLAIIPLFFGIQQFFEGLIWLSFNRVEFAQIQSVATISFLAFAWVVWPTLVPYAAYRLEEDNQRKKWLKGMLTLGVISSLYSVYRMYTGHPFPYIAEFHIDYRFSDNNERTLLDMPQQLAYLISTVIPLFISSRYGVFWLAVGNFVSLLLAYFFFKHALPSTWCFFAAILSGVIWWILHAHPVRREKNAALSS